MRYKHILTNDTISQVDYNYLSTVDQIEYTPVKEDDTFLESAVIGAATDSALLGGLLGGDMLGGIVGDLFNGGSLFD